MEPLTRLENKTPGSLRRIIRALMFGLGALLLMGCQAEIEATVDVQEDGSGTVVAAVIVDREAAALILDLESTDGIPLADVFASGWEVERPTLEEDGRTRIEAIKAFGNPEQFGQIMEELAGPNRLFTDFELVREKAFARVDYTVTGAIRPTGFASFSDTELEALLGQSLSDLAIGIGADPGSVDVVLQVSLPGDVAPGGSNGIQTDGADPRTRFWTTSLGATGGPTTVDVTATTRETGALVALGISIVSGALALVLLLGLVLRLIQGERRRKARPVKRPPARTVRSEETIVLPDDDNDQESGGPASGNPKVVALDGMGVIYGRAADIQEVLVPFCHSKGSQLTSDEIAAKARALSLGNIDPAAFWRFVGIDEDPEELDEEYLNLHPLQPGVVRFLRNLRERGVRVACITNDSPGWALKLRRKHSLEGLIEPWIISGNVGARKPDRPIFEVLRRLTGEPPAAIMVVDDQLEILDAARELGYRTAWFAPDGRPEDARGHSILRSFDVPDAPPAQSEPATPEPAQ